MKRYFVTGTDTDIGKTYVAESVVAYFCEQGLSVGVLKPVASGGIPNEDALRLQRAAGGGQAYDAVNPIALQTPAAPHLVAHEEGVSLCVEDIMSRCQVVLKASYDKVVIEGAGGLLVPLNDKETFCDLAKAFNAAVILVVGMRLGCLNHALLTAEVLRQRRLPVAGWVANVIEPDMLCLAENIETLKARLPFPHLATFPFAPEASPLQRTRQSAGSGLGFDNLVSAPLEKVHA